MASADNIIIAECVPCDKGESKELLRSMSMHGEKSYPYRAYLLRCWREKGEATPGKEPLWRFSAEEILPFDPSAGSGQRKLRTLPERRRKGFGSLGALIAFLQGELTGGEDEPSDDEM